ncbi:unnamed protein product [Effrenium voratum]|uniref:Uncharacterized protein n=1 Tax=Effrenium voratum TaxID=2562239 RepID=A0AA36MWW3_9DINO|nr:unnamed protein product [Effrenium voratum]
MTEKTAWYRRMPTAALQRGFTLPNLLNITYVDTAKVSGWFNQRRKPSGLSRGPPPKASCKQIFQAFGKLYKPYFCDKKSRWRAWPLLLICVIFMYFEVQTGVDISDAVKDVNNALVAQEKDQFYQELRNAALIAVRLIPILLMHLGAACYLALDWRKYLTQKVLDMYVDEKQCFYRLKTEYGNLDNPDQRIAQDIGNFCRMSLRLMSALVLDVFKIAANSAALIQISAFLFYTLVGCSFLYTFVSLVIFAAPMMRVQRRILAVEGDLRYVLVRLREHAESVAFFRGHQYERQCSDKVLDHVIWSNYKKAAIEVTFRMVTGVVQMAFMLMPMMIVAPMFLSGAVTFGTIQQSQILFANLMSGMMDLGKELDSFASLGAESVRVQELWDALEEVHATEREGQDKEDDTTTIGASSDAESTSDLENSSQASEVDEDLVLQELDMSTPVRLQLCSVALFPPLSKEPLLSNISLTLREGESLLIEGPSGTGKSSLLRAIAGLWSRGHGTIRRTAVSRCFFVPQKPYLCLGSLRDNVLYPSTQRLDVSDNDVVQVLGTLGISHLAERHGLDTELDFDNILSGGEKQRLGFARLLIQEDVALALLDEATSALDEQNEHIAYELLQKKVRCYVSVGHRPSLVACHTTRLKLQRPEKKPDQAEEIV